MSRKSRQKQARNEAGGNQSPSSDVILNRPSLPPFMSGIGSPSLPSAPSGSHAHMSVSTTTYTTPFPPPEELRKYEALLPGSAGDIIELIKSQTKHRQALEAKVIGGSEVKSDRGQIFAFFLVLACLGVVCYAIHEKCQWVGSILGGTTMVSIAAIFVYGKYQQRKDLDGHSGRLPQNKNDNNVPGKPSRI